MTLWREKEIEMTLQSDVRGVSIFSDIECTALVEYDAIEGEIEWKMNGFKFINYRTHQVTIITEDQDCVHWAILKNAIDDNVIWESLRGGYEFSIDAESGYGHSPKEETS